MKQNKEKGDFSFEIERKITFLVLHSAASFNRSLVYIENSNNHYYDCLSASISKDSSCHQSVSSGSCLAI